MSHREDIQCPSCHQECVVELDAPADMVLLVCPKCGTHIVHYHGQAFAISGHEFGFLRKQGKSKTIDGTSSTPRHTPTKPKLPTATHKAGEPVRSEIIGNDDIIDLHQTLEQAQSVEEFLKLLESRG